MRNPSKRMGRLRPATFAHSFVITVSPAGMFLYRAYSHRGYTLLQHVEQHDQTYPKSLEDGEAWVKRFEEFAAELGGIWTDKVNAAYTFCFGIDLVAFGNMNIGSQLDTYYQVYKFEFDAQTVRNNFAVLPQSEGTTTSQGQKIPCDDGHHAKSSKYPPGEAEPDGGIRHYYDSKL